MKRKSSLMPDVVYLTTKQVADIMQAVEPERKWTARKARAWLAREGALTKRGGRHYTTSERLRAAFPEVFESFAWR